MVREHKIPSIRLSELEEDKMLQLMAQHNLKKTALIRKLIMDQKLKPPVIDNTVGMKMLADIRKMGADLNKLGSNVNQIAKHLNEKGLKDEHEDRLNTTLLTMIEEQQELKNGVEQLWQQLSTVLLKK